MAASDDDALIAEALSAADGADAIVLVLGDMHQFFGECCSTATLELQGGQIALAEALSRTGTPVVVVLINSKPMVLPPAVLYSDTFSSEYMPTWSGFRCSLLVPVMPETVISVFGRSAPVMLVLPPPCNACIPA